MKVSIIVPFHKGKLFLEDCFVSIEAQKIEDYETLVIKDHEEENIDDLIEKYKDKIHISVYELENQKGVSAARNLGIEKASGDYIYFLDADDFLTDDGLSLLVNEAEKKSYDIVYGIVEDSWYKRSSFLDEYYNDKEGEHFTTFVSKEVNRRQQINDHINDSAYEYLLGCRRHLSRISALHILMKKSLLDQNKIKFVDELELYADAPFVSKLISSISSEKVVPKAVYAKRMHNDEINYPTLDKIKRNDRSDQYALSYEKAIELCKDDKKIMHQIQWSMCNFYVTTVIHRLRRGEKDTSNNANFEAFSKFMQDVDSSVIREFERPKRKLLLECKKGDKKAALKSINRYLAKKKFFKMFSSKRKFYKTLYQYVFSKMKLKNNYVMFESFLGRNYSDSPKYIYLYMLHTYGDKFKYIWFFDEKKQSKSEIEGNPICVKRFSLKYYYYIAVSKYWVHNMRQPVWWDKRKNQVFMETWHGTPLKKLVFDMEDLHFSNKDYKHITYRQSRKWDYLVSANPFSTEVFQSAFMFPKEQIIETGYPRNDIMYAENAQEIADNLRKKFGIPLDKKTILYAPTWRDDEYDLEGQVFELKLDLKKMKEKLGEDYVVLLRTHYHIAEKMDISGMGLDGFAFNFCKYDDISELYLISDICITDYSSVFFDYANLRRPLLFYTYDLDKYRDVLRGFYVDIETTVPGPLLFTTDEVIDAIENIDKVEEEYKERYDEFYQRFCSVDDGNASKRVTEIMLNHKNKKGRA